MNLLIEIIAISLLAALAISLTMLTLTLRLLLRSKKPNVILTTGFSDEEVPTEKELPITLGASSNNARTQRMSVERIRKLVKNSR